MAGHCFAVEGERLCPAVESMGGFDGFLVNEGHVLFSFVECAGRPEMEKTQYEFSYEDVNCVFGKTRFGHMLSLKPLEEESLDLWCNEGEDQVKICGNMSLHLLRFAMWVGLGLKVVPYDTVAVHSSCIVYNGEAVLFLGESGTGKSTHTRLWRENIEGAFLLNDDSPVLRYEDGAVWAYGSPWSGKTPCYKQERYKLKACVRLSQSQANDISRLDILQSFGAIHPSCPPEFAYDDLLYDHVCSLIDKLLSSTPFYHLACRPDREAALLAFRTIF